MVSPIDSARILGHLFFIELESFSQRIVKISVLRILHVHYVIQLARMCRVQFLCSSISLTIILTHLPHMYPKCNRVSFYSQRYVARNSFHYITVDMSKRVEHCACV